MKAESSLRLLMLLGSFLLALPLAPASARAESPEAQWIWSPAYPQDKIPAGECYFRKTFQLGAVETAEVQITADAGYELYVNARLVGSGNNWKVLDRHDIADYLTPGRNTIAVKADSGEKGSAGLVARVLIKPQGEPHVAYSTDTTWKTGLKVPSQWNHPRFDDSQWLAAQSFGPLGGTLPWGNETHLAGDEGRFSILPEFQVEVVATAEETGSLIAMTFNEFGQIIASRERGPLLLLSDTDGDGVHDKVTTYCEEVTSCQGLLAINGHVLAIGQGPEGAAVYRLSDTDRDQKIDEVKALLHFEGPIREHGAHGLVLGPDGLVYIMVGNHTTIDTTRKEFAPSSPLRDYYEGDLVQPRHEDPRGHAVGVKVPGGTILRMDIEGRVVEQYAGGLRNAYDLAFNQQGELFTYDSDMEVNMGMNFYRPTRLNHVIAGADLGWRSGWAKFPSYYLDGLAATAEMGPGSPTGLVFYNHFKYPLRYHNTLFAADWARGRIVSIRLDPQGGSYEAHTSVLMEGRPLNATDLAVGPDGALYFCTGGRDTAGGIYCITWRGSVPPEVADLGTGIEQAIRQPQLESAWARQQVAKVRRTLGDDWEPQLVAIARDTQRSTAHRTRALELMQLLGPFPPVALLFDLTKDPQAEVRARAAYLLGIHADDLAKDRLVKLLDDTDPLVRRLACESLVRTGQTLPAARLVDLLLDTDRHVAFAARRALERIPSNQWRTLVLEHDRTRIFLHGSVALLTAAPSRELALEIIARCERMLAGEVRDPKYPPGFISDHDFTDLLRVAQLALIRGELASEEVPALGPLLAREYPSADTIMNRELVRLLVTLGEPTVTERMIEQLTDPDLPEIERRHIAMHAPFLKSGWTTQQKLELVQYYEQARSSEGGTNIATYMDISCRTLMKSFTQPERLLVFQQGTRWPSAALSALASLSGPPDEELLEAIIRLDKQLSQMEGEEVTRLRTGVVAVLGHHHTPESMAYLRELYETDPDRRETIAIGLAQAPAGENWPLLVQSLSIVEGHLATEVLKKLTQVDRRPEDPEALRQAILCGLRLKEAGALHAVALLRHWTEAQPVATDESWESQLVAWQAWFHQHHPEMPQARLPVESEQSKWTYQELLSYLTGPAAEQADARRGALVFEQAQCAKCHRYGEHGQSVGPDLTTISRRFQKKELLQSIVFPSHVISDQYASKSIITLDGHTLTGIVAPAGPDSVSVVGIDGRRQIVTNDEIEEIIPSNVSAMPEGLLDPLTLEQIADLFAYLSEPPRENITSRRGTAPR